MKPGQLLATSINSRLLLNPLTRAWAQHGSGHLPRLPSPLPGPGTGACALPAALLSVTHSRR